jgi:hypothetical protein
MSIEHYTWKKLIRTKMGPGLISLLSVLPIPGSNHAESGDTKVDTHAEASEMEPTPQPSSTPHTVVATVHASASASAAVTAAELAACSSRKLKRRRSPVSSSTSLHINDSVVLVVGYTLTSSYHIYLLAHTATRSPNSKCPPGKASVPAPVPENIAHQIFSANGIPK